MNPEQLLAELSAVQARLSELPKDAHEERFQLREHQKELRELSRRQLAQLGDLLSADEVRTRLRQLESQREQYLNDTRLSHLAGAQTGQGGGIDPKIVHDMHRNMDESFNLDGLTAEIKRLRRRLATLEGT